MIKDFNVGSFANASPFKSGLYKVYINEEFLYFLPYPSSALQKLKSSLYGHPNSPSYSPINRFNHSSQQVPQVISLLFQKASSNRFVFSSIKQTDSKNAVPNDSHLYSPLDFLCYTGVYRLHNLTLLVHGAYLLKHQLLFLDLDISVNYQFSILTESTPLGLLRPHVLHFPKHLHIIFLEQILYICWMHLIFSALFEFIQLIFKQFSITGKFNIRKNMIDFVISHCEIIYVLFSKIEFIDCCFWNCHI